jgi:thymidine kinase
MKSVQNKKKIFIYVLLGLAFFFSYPMAVMAHPPKTFTAVYDIASQKLTVRIDHGTFSPKMHYINIVEVKKNAQVVINQTYKSQPDKNPFEYTYELPARAGDVLEIKASCNMYGSKTISITVAQQDK